ncbi:MAG: undecaprenyl-phosphate glucose phosphotransferase [Nitrospiraceae bacterium]
MLKRHAEFLKSVLFLVDLALICVCWVLAYDMRIAGFPVPVTKGIPPLGPYVGLLIPIVLVWGIAFQAFNLYRPRRMGSHLEEVMDLAKANSLAVLVLVAISFFMREYEFSRLVFVNFWLLNMVALSGSRMMFREGLRFMRRHGLNQRHALIVGSGRVAQSLVERIAQHPEFGITTRGYVVRSVAVVGQAVNGLPVLGGYDDLARLCVGTDIVFVCLPVGEEAYAEKIVAMVANTTVEVKVIPSICELVTLRAEAEMFEGLPVITLQGSPLYGWNVVIKRALDIVGSTAVLTLGAPVLLAIGLLVKWTSPGPVLYRQVRMGLDGRAFEMLKFRSMRVGAEKETGAVWADADDPRRTSFGTFLRKTSLDELPQFWNVLVGQMSIVGPRPERPELIARFREQLPMYMLRHKMKAGITGWAQVNGWRGNTSLEKRIEYDLYYIEHWSIWFDLKIMWHTLWKGFIHRHAY